MIGERLNLTHYIKGNHHQELLFLKHQNSFHTRFFASLGTKTGNTTSQIKHVSKCLKKVCYIVHNDRQTRFYLNKVHKGCPTPNKI